MSRLTIAIAQSTNPTDYLLLCVKSALEEAREQHPQPYVDANHLVGVLTEEFEELKREAFRKRIRPEQMQTELLQIAAVACRGIQDLTLNQKPKRP